MPSHEHIVNQILLTSYLYDVEIPSSHQKHIAKGLEKTTAAHAFVFHRDRFWEHVCERVSSRIELSEPSTGLKNAKQSSAREEPTQRREPQTSLDATEEELSCMRLRSKEGGQLRYSYIDSISGQKLGLLPVLYDRWMKLSKLCQDKLRYTSLEAKLSVFDLFEGYTELHNHSSLQDLIQSSNDTYAIRIAKAFLRNNGNICLPKEDVKEKYRYILKKLRETSTSSPRIREYIGETKDGLVFYMTIKDKRAIISVGIDLFSAMLQHKRKDWPDGDRVEHGPGLPGTLAIVLDELGIRGRIR